MDDYSGTLAGLSVAAAITAIIGAGAIMAAPGFARWLTNKVATFFDGVSEPGEIEDGDNGDDYESDPCPECGSTVARVAIDDEGAGCEDCGTYVRFSEE
ncbi:MAG TPA: hypothetical protein VNR18_00780 [Hyphomicrobiales bacterium]|nr:hypothetical protein [Hyphomicrobiales bacterium]